MTDDEREAAAKWLERGSGSDAEKRRQARVMAVQLRADGERIKALEEALEAAASALRFAPHYPLPIVDAEPVPPYGETLARRMREVYRAAMVDFAAK